jgi:menaquinone-specific isochorismate synthase
MHTIDTKYSEIRERFARLLRQIPGRPDGGIHRIEIPWPRQDALNWLSLQNHDIKIYWADRQKHLVLAGIGETVSICGDEPNVESILKKIRERLKGSDPRVRFIGGIAFDSGPLRDPLWAPFKAFRFIVPRFEFQVLPDSALLAFHFIQRGSDRAGIENQFMHELQRLKLNGDAKLTLLPDFIHRKDEPDWQRWQHQIDASLQAFSDQILQKVVLAKRTEYQLKTSTDPITLLRHLAPQHAQAFHFALQLGDSGFTSVTPERLYYRKEDELYSEAVAGTRRRGKTRSMDEKLGTDLLTSEKDLREHRWVSDVVRSHLEPLCKRVDKPEKERLLKLAHVQHLFTPFHGQLKNGISDGKIVGCLHPTPAVGGHPKDKAYELIRELETFDRGWYAGPIGWINGTGAEFAVAIRSALLNAQQLILYAGSGIVQGSTAEKEWEETEIKLLNFTRLFQGNGH